MTDRLWNYLEAEFEALSEYTTFNKKNNDYIEIKTDQGIFVVEPIYDCDNSQIIDFAVYHGSYTTTVKEEPDIWFWEEIEKAFREKEPTYDL